jgi:hypothetical protein
VGHPEAAAGDEVEAQHAAAVGDRDQSAVVGVQVDAVVDVDRDAGLELAREVLPSVERLLLAALEHSLSVEPDLVIGAGRRRQRRGEFGGDPLHRPVHLVCVGCRRRHHVALHIAAGREGGKQHPVDLGKRFLEVALQDAVVLDALPRGDPKGAIRIGVGEPVKCEILARGELSARDVQADHHRVALLRADAPVVPVVLLVDAVELQQLLVILGEAAGRLVAERCGDRAAKPGACGLDRLDLRWLIPCVFALSHRRASVWIVLSFPCSSGAACRPHSVFGVPGQRPSLE